VVRFLSGSGVVPVSGVNQFDDWSSYDNIGTVMTISSDNCLLSLVCFSRVSILLLFAGVVHIALWQHDDIHLRTKTEKSFWSGCECH
jgi:hypothetical protein